MTPWCDDLVCSGRCLLADRQSLPFPWTLSLRRRWCLLASHHHVAGGEKWAGIGHSIRIKLKPDGPSGAR